MAAQQQPPNIPPLGAGAHNCGKHPRLQSPITNMAGAFADSLVA